MAGTYQSFTKCWECEWAAGKDGKCPWASRFEPVPGWKAKPTQILIGGEYAKKIDSFIVEECPMFELMTELKRRKAEAKARKKEIISQYRSCELYEQVERLWLEENKTIEEIAAELGYSAGYIYSIIRQIKELIENGK